MSHRSLTTRAVSPFVRALAALSVVVTGAAAHAETQKAEARPAVTVTAELEHQKLLAERGGEVFARIVLEGAEAPQQTDRLPVSLTLIIDTSGSMDGDKIVQARQSAIRAIDQLHKGDKVSVVLFSTGATALLAGAEIGKDDVSVVKQALSQVQANGGTDMIAGLDTGGQRARALFSSNRTNRVLLLSDGHPNTSQGLEERIAALAKDGILTTTLGLGRDYNEDLMSKLADAGLGNYHFIENANQLAGIFEKELRTLGSVVAKEAVASIALKDGVEVVEVYGYSISRGQRSVAIPVGDVFGGRRADILAKVRFPAAQVGSGQLLEVKVTYHDALAGVARKVQLPLVATFTKDQSAVTASVIPAVLEKAELVRTAEAMKAATEAYARGERDRAQAIVKEQKMNLSNYNTQMAGSAYAPAAAKMQTDFDALEAEAEDAKTDKEVLKKKAKAAARSMSR